MLISDILRPSMIRLDLKSASKEELFEEMVQMYVSAGIVKDREGAVMALLEREAKMSTGISSGFALPHGKIPEVKGVQLALGVVPEGMDFESLDDEPVYVVIMLFSEPGNPTPHIEALSEISRLLLIPGFLDRIRAAKNAQEVLKVIRAEE